MGRDYPVVFAANARNERPPAIALPDSFGRVMPFRYVEVENLRVPAGDFFVKKKVFNWRFDDSASYFVSSDTVLNRVWEMCKHTVKATSFCGLYVDGDRERTPYEADALINQLSHYAVDREYSLARRTNAYFIDHPTWPTEWILQTPSLFYNDYLYTGDTGALSKYYSALKEKTLVALEREDGLISVGSPAMGDGLMKSIGFSGGAQRIRDIVDWPVSERDGYEMMAYNTVVNAFHYQSLVVMGEIAGALGRKEDSVEFFRRALLVKDAVNHRMLDKSRGIYVDGEGSVHSSLHANLFPLAFGMVPKENMSAVVAFVKSRGMACSVYGAQYLLEALYRSGEADYALSLMDDTAGDRNWWNMIESGSTMALEAWDIKYKPNLDWNHAWGTAPANVVVRDMWGIRPMKPGFASVVVKPQLGRLAWSRIKVPTMRGAIRAEYDKGEYMIELSKGMAGRFELRGVGVVLHEGRNRVSSRLPVIFDTDMGPDYDDVGAIAMLHAFADSGMAEILGTIASNKYEGVAGVLNVFNTYFGRPEIPIGVPRGKAVDQRDGQHWTDSVLAKYPHVIRRNDEVADAVDLYRRLLAGSKDSSVVIITVGFLTNLSNLLKSGPDEYSSLGGIELVKRKVRRAGEYGGKFSGGQGVQCLEGCGGFGVRFCALADGGGI
ncbi:alpha-L-rhamnosidase C-terminal domain-containing protein [Puia sp. P3]|uniref:alpha-L-rhamnosidase-related protein n=1 Tax=Puia sp. P3 TaxID=3423952 RepID=UPI003D672D16